MCRNKGTATHTKHILKVTEVRSHNIVRKKVFEKERKKRKKKEEKGKRGKKRKREEKKIEKKR